MRNDPMKNVIVLTVNGERHEVAAEPHVTLLEVLREEIGLKGSKEACGTGECGTCTVLVDGRPMLACLVLAFDCEGQEITTVEGLSEDGRLNPLQQAFQDVGAIQCGFCTPGMLLSTTALLRERPDPTRWEIQKALEGNLCRCTGYNKIMDAVERAAADYRRAEPAHPAAAEDRADPACPAADTAGRGEGR